MPRSVAIIGAGQIGYAAWRALTNAGHSCRVYARRKPAWNAQNGVEYRSYLAGEDKPPAADIVLDTIAFDDENVAKYDPVKIGRLIVISSASVYCDAEGRTLDEGPVKGYPQFDTPITEDNPTVAPGPETYSTRKIRMENKAAEMFGAGATVLRPCAIYGERSRHPREWWFVKRILDGRDRIPLIYQGRSQFQTTAASWLAQTALATAENGLGGVFNVSDKTAPSVAEIGTAIASHLGSNPRFEPIADAHSQFVGRTPWSIPSPMIVDGSKASRAIGKPSPDYATRSQASVAWLQDLNPPDWKEAFPQLAAYPWDLFDYDAEDRFFASL